MPDPTQQRLDEMNPAEAGFAEIVALAIQEPEVNEGRAFHSPALKVGGKIFAMLVGQALVVKLPAERCAGLVASGPVQPFRSGGRRMREWVSVGEEALGDWPALAGEALTFVRQGTRDR